MKLLSGCKFAWVVCGVIASGLAVGSAMGKSSGEKPATDQTARQVDQLLVQEVCKTDAKLAPRVGDAAYLRWDSDQIKRVLKTRIAPSLFTFGVRR